MYRKPPLVVAKNRCRPLPPPPNHHSVCGKSAYRLRTSRVLRNKTLFVIPLLFFFVNPTTPFVTRAHPLKILSICLAMRFVCGDVFCGVSHSLSFLLVCRWCWAMRPRAGCCVFVISSNHQWRMIWRINKVCLSMCVVCEFVDSDSGCRLHIFSRSVFDCCSTLVKWISPSFGLYTCDVYTLRYCRPYCVNWINWSHGWKIVKAAIFIFQIIKQGEFFKERV